MSESILFVLNHGVDRATAPTFPKYFTTTMVDIASFQSPGTNPYELLSFLWKKHRVKILYTIGGSRLDFLATWGPLHAAITRVWVHLERFDQFNSHRSTEQAIVGPEISPFPIISINMTTFKSIDKIHRPLESLARQTYPHWEMNIWDDSPDDHHETWKELVSLSKKDMRINVYRSEHNGSIGEMKRRSGSLATGHWLAEIDHDDHFADNLFEMIVDVGRKNPKCGFIYSDCMMLSEVGEMPHYMGDGCAFGYGAYMNQWRRGKVHYAYQTQGMNPTTVRGIVGVPNHVRVWRRDVYERIGKHHAHLSVADDYDLLLRTFLDDCEWVRIPYCAYYQYNNEARNNFTYIRFDLIQENSKCLWVHYQHAVNEKFRKIGMGAHVEGDVQCWTHAAADYRRYERTYYENKTRFTAIIPVLKSTKSSQLQKTLRAALEMDPQPLICLVGHPDSCLREVMTKLYQDANTLQANVIGADAAKYQWKMADLERVLWWDFRVTESRIIQHPQEIWAVKKPYMHHLMNYALKICARTEWVFYLNPGTTPSKYLLAALTTMAKKATSMDAIIIEKMLFHREELPLLHGTYWTETDTEKTIFEKYSTVRDNAKHHVAIHDTQPMPSST